jgi:cytochrome c-type biogenesis protein CcmH
MSLFFLFAVLMLALALLFMLLPLLKVAGGARTSERNLIETAYRTQFEELKSDLASGTLDVEQYEVSKRELETRMQEDLAQVATSTVADSPDSRMLARTALALGLSVPIAAAALYAWLGQPEAIMGAAAPNTPSADAPDNAPHSLSGAQIEAMVQKLADRLKDKPNDLQGWYMLARSYASLGRFPESLKALDHARQLAPNEPQLMADYADVLATTTGGSLEGEPAKLIQKALKLDPNNAKALALAGEREFRNKNYQSAIDYWTRMKNALPPDAKPEQIAGVEKNINQARVALGQAPLPLSASMATPVQEAAAPETPTTSAVAGRTISGVVTLSPKLAGKIGPNDTLFIFARAASGPRMPLAVLRVSASELPKTFTLDDSMAMSPAMKLSDFPQVVISARVSKSGTATPQSGDFSATIGPVSPGTTDLKLTIDTIVQ